jgi:hypothetical protein
LASGSGQYDLDPRDVHQCGHDEPLPVSLQPQTVRQRRAALERPEGSGLPPYLGLISLFAGLFVFHYFVETFIWKFSDPYYRQSLGPLYFGQKPAPKPGTT